MLHSEIVKLDSMQAVELRALARRQAAEIVTLRGLRGQDPTTATRALQQIQGSDCMPPPSSYGCLSEAH